MSVTVELNDKGIIELFKSAEIANAIKEAGDAVASASGPDYEASVHNASFTAICNVYPNSKSAAHENFKNNTLVKSIGVVGLPTKKPHL